MNPGQNFLRITVARSGRSFAAGANESILDAALRAGYNLPHSCKGGNCGSCLARVLAGEFVYAHGRPLGISDAEIAEGLALLCRAQARSDLHVDLRTVSPASEIIVKRLPCRAERCEMLSHDVMGVYLRLPAVEDFDFFPGQYVDVMLSGGRRRSFSIASPPQRSKLLELHVRHVAGGEFSERLFGGQMGKALLNIEGPLGQFVYRESNAPMLMIGGGTGLAPLNSILRHVIAHRLERAMTLFWGVRSERDLYAHESLLGLMRANANFKYIPVLSEPSAAWTGERGLVHESAMRAIADLTASDIYASGPPQMIDSVRTDFGARGVAAERLYFDSFDYAPDTLERQRKSAPNVS